MTSPSKTKMSNQLRRLKTASVGNVNYLFAETEQFDYDASVFGATFFSLIVRDIFSWFSCAHEVNA